jgi:hypothetical protein
MNIAYCIICHRNTNILRTTIKILSKDNDIFLHVDKKTNISDFDEYKNYVFFIKQRIDIRWGGYSQIESMLELLNEARKGEYDYICLLSGDDLPLKNSSEIKEIFEENRGKEFIGIVKDFDGIKLQLEDRLKYKHSSLSIKRTKNNFEELIAIIQKKLKLSNTINKYYKMLPPLYKGANWFCITNQLTNYIFEYLENNEWYKKAFKYSLCGDEEFFQTIVMNSGYKDRIYNYEAEHDDMVLRYIDWVSGPEYPKVLTESDLKNIKNTNYIFGRKFSENINIAKYKYELNID